MPPPSLDVRYYELARSRQATRRESAGQRLRLPDPLQASSEVPEDNPSLGIDDRRSS